MKAVSPDVLKRVKDFMWQAKMATNPKSWKQAPALPAVVADKLGDLSKLPRKIEHGEPEHLKLDAELSQLWVVEVPGSGVFLVDNQGTDSAVKVARLPVTARTRAIAMVSNESISTLADLRKRIVAATQVVGRNIINVEEIDAWIEDLKNKIDRDASNINNKALGDEILKWFKTTYRKYLINSYEKTKKVIKIPSKAPEWMKKAFEEGAKLEAVVLEAKLKEEADHLIDLFIGGKFSPRISVPDAQKMAEHEAKMGPFKGKDTKEDIELYEDLGEGYYVVRLKSKEAIKREGERKGLCLKYPDSWFNASQKGEIILLSIRTPEGYPMATIEVKKSGQIAQMRGAQNSVVRGEDREFLMKFLRKAGAIK